MSSFIEIKVFKDYFSSKESESVWITKSVVYAKQSEIKKATDVCLQDGTYLLVDMSLQDFIDLYSSF